jgi:hypothetical protein
LRLLDKVIRGSPGRLSRFHDARNTLALRTASDCLDASYALCTAILRVTVGYRPRHPMMACNAVRFLRDQLRPEWKVFEWGLGMSTLWFERHCAEVHAVDDQPDWCSRVQAQARRARVYYLWGKEYVDRIRQFPRGYFDLVSIDGGYRLACLEAALDSGARMILLDDTDSPDLTALVARISQLPAWVVRRFTGFSPGYFWAKETTILRAGA